MTVKEKLKKHKKKTTAAVIGACLLTALLAAAPALCSFLPNALAANVCKVVTTELGKEYQNYNDEDVEVHGAEDTQASTDTADIQR